MRLTLLSVLLFSLTSVFAFEPGKGSIAGKIIDAKNADVLIGVSVFIENTTVGCASDIDGNFVISGVAEGKYNVVFKYIGYQQKIERDIVVENGKVTSLTVSMKEEQVNLNEVVVKADIVKRDNESAIVVMQRNSTIIQSGISSEEMKRSPDKSSGDVIKRVSGSTIQDGKFAIIRGLSDRYNIALLNNVMLPSTEPDRKAFAFDVFPSNILDNIIIMKTGQPNLPSEWAGGNNSTQHKRHSGKKTSSMLAMALVLMKEQPSRLLMYTRVAKQIFLDSTTACETYRVTSRVLWH